MSNYDQLVGEYTNPILKPWAAEVVKKYGEISLAGVTFPSPSNQCWPEPVPYIFKHGAMQMLQQPDKITILYNEDHEVRWVRMNQPHPAQVTPSWHGDSVGHYEGDTLVIDTVGVSVRMPRMTWTALPITSAGRFSPLGPRGRWRRNTSRPRTLDVDDYNDAQHYMVGIPPHLSV